MATRTGERDFDCEPDTLWQRVFFSVEYNRKLFLERLKFEQWEVAEQVETADGFIRTVHAKPRVGDLPGPIKTLLKNGMGYTERGEYFRSQSRFVIAITPNSLAEKLKISAEVRVTPLAGGRCRRLSTTSVEAKIFGVGGMLEKLILDDIEKSYDRFAILADDWLRQV
jgi:Protein of unknown function (DUF2505)